MTKIATFEAVAAAAKSLSDAGEKPTVRKIVTALGGGSPNKVTALLSEWKAGRMTVSDETFQLSDAVLNAVRKEVKEAADAAALAAEDRAADAEDTLALMRGELATVEHEAATLADRVTVAEATLEHTRKTAENVQAELKKTSEELASVRLLADQRLVETSALSTKNTSLDDQVRRLTAELERTVSALSEVNARATSALGEANARVTGAEQKAATAAAQVEVLTARISDGQGQIESLKGSVLAAEKRLSDAEARHSAALEKAQIAVAAAGIEKAKLEGRLAAIEEAQAKVEKSTK